MAFNWTDRQNYSGGNTGDFVDANDINSIAHEVIDINKRVGTVPTQDQIKTETDKINSVTTKLSDSVENIAETTRSVIPDVKVSTYSRVSSLSDKAREGQMNTKISGSTLNNLFYNGGFENGLSGLVQYQKYGTQDFAIDTTDKHSGNASLKCSTTNYSKTVASKATVKSGNKYYIQFWYKTDAGVICGSGTSDGTINSQIQIADSSGVWKMYTGIFLPTNDGVFSFVKKITGTYLNVDDFNIIDMGADTSNPLYNKTQAEMEAMTPYYIDGLSGVIGGAVRSCGKNLFDKNRALDNYGINTTDGSIGVFQGQFVTDYMPCTAIMSYIHNRGLLTAYRGTSAVFYDANKSIVSFVANEIIITPPQGARYMRLSCVKTDTPMESFQVEAGTSRNTIEPYTETISYAPDRVYNSVPSIKDTYDFGTGIDTQNVQEYTLQASEVLELRTFYTNFDCVRILKKTDYVKYGSTSQLQGTITSDKYTAKDWVTLDSADNIGYIMVLSGTEIIITFPKNTYTSLAQAQTALTGTKILYQLATPIVKEYLPQPVKSSPKGMITYLNRKRLIGTYTTKADVQFTKATIKTVTRLEKVLPDGTRIPLSANVGLTVASDGLSFTHTGLVLRDIYEAEYEFDVTLGTTPLIDFEYKNRATLDRIVVPTLLNLWTADGVIGYYEHDEKLEFIGGVKGGTVGQIIFTIAEPYRLDRTTKVTVVSNNALAILEINVNGNVTLLSGSNASVDLNNISIRRKR